MLIGSSDFLSGPVREQPFSCAPYFHAILIGANDKPISNKLRNFDPPLFQSRIKRVAQPRSDAWHLVILKVDTRTLSAKSAVVKRHNGIRQIKQRCIQAHPRKSRLRQTKVTCKLCTFMFWKFCYLGGVIVRGVFVLGG